MVEGTAPHGAIATSNYHATDAGAEILRQGGTAVDAAIAAAATLCVVYPNQVALGGDLVAVVRSPSGQVKFVNATGPAPESASLERMQAKHGVSMPRSGVDTISVPGAVAGWKALDQLGGSLPWSERLAVAIRLAEEGAPAALSVARAAQRERSILSQDVGASSMFLPGGEPIQEGELLQQPALAKTLDRLGSYGPDEFYIGEVGRQWKEGLNRLGSDISADDLAGYSPVVEASLSAEVFGMRVHTGQPNTQGFSLLRTLLALESGPGLEAPPEEFTQILRDSDLVRDAYLSDPAVLPIDAGELLSLPVPGPSARHLAGKGDTVGLSAVSNDGWAVSLVQSVFFPFGSGVLEPETGILFQNRAMSFSLKPDHPAALGPGLRPPHSLMPVIVERGGALKYVLATMGGPAQPQVHAHLIRHLLAGASPVEATAAPRWIVGAAGGRGHGFNVIAEADLPLQVLASLGHEKAIRLQTVPPRNEQLGHSNVVEVFPEGQSRYRAASDPRSDGSARVI